MAIEDLPVSIKGDSLYYHDTEIIASGNASISYNNLSVAADLIKIDTKANKIAGQGRVQIKEQGKETVPAEQFLLDMTTEALTLTDVNYSFKPAMSARDIFINFATGNMKADQQRPGKDLLQGKRVFLTTCDLDAPHYWVSAKEFLYYPDQKIVAYHMTTHFWFSPVPVFYTPYYVFNLGKRNIIFTFPKFGSNTVEGRFAKTETLYFIDENNDGSVYVDAMEFKGNGKGFKHNYNFGDPGSLLYYTVVEQDIKPKRQSHIATWQQKVHLSPEQELDVLHRYRKMYLLPYGYEDHMDDSVAYRYSDQENNAVVDYAIRQDYQAKTEGQTFASDIKMGAHTQKINWQKDFRAQDMYRYEAINIDHAVQLDPEWRYRVNPRLRRSTVLEKPFEQKMDLSMELALTPKEQKHIKSMIIQTDWYYDLDTVTENNESAEFIERMPEVTVIGRSVPIGGIDDATAAFTLDHAYTSGLLREAKYFAAYDQRRVFQTTRLSAALTPHKTYDLGWAVVNVQRTYKQTTYGTNDAHYLLSDRPFVKTDWWGFYRNSLEYEDTRGEGNSPFFFDDPRVVAVKRGRHAMTWYQRQQWDATMSLGKDFQNNLFDDYIYALNADPFENKKVTIGMNSGKNYYTNIYRDLITTMQMNPVDRQYYRLSFTKDINNNCDENVYAGKLKTASSEADIYLGAPYENMKYWNFWESEWRFTVKNVYDFQTEYFNLYSFGLAKDLHCWTMKYNFTPVRKEWWIVFSLKAFPGEPLSVHGNEDKDFSFEAFKDTVQATEVRRGE